MTKKLHKRYEYWEDSDTAYDTKIKYGQYFRIIDKKECVDLLNEQEEEINELKTRNKIQFNLLNEITDLMMKRDWKGLEMIVEDWEASERLLQAEWGNYGDVND